MCKLKGTSFKRSGGEVRHGGQRAEGQRSNLKMGLLEPLIRKYTH